MSDSDQSGHWQFLVNILGAKPKEDPAAEAAKSSEPPAGEEPSGEEPKGSVPPGRSPSPAKPKKPARKTGGTIREKLTHWSNVLRSVGVEPSPSDFELPAEEPEPAEQPKMDESIPSPFAQGTADSSTSPPGEASEAAIDPLEAWPSKPARSAPSGRPDRGREARGAGGERQRDSGRERHRDREREGEHKRERERDERVRERDREKDREQSESGERTSERRGERRRRRRSDRSRAHDEHSETRPVDEPAESLLDDELADLELEPTEPSAGDDEVRDTSEGLESERRGRRRRRGRRGRRDRDASAESGGEKDRPRARIDEGDDLDHADDDVEARIETPFETVDVEFDDEECETRSSASSREAREERADRERAGRRRRRRSRSGRGDDAGPSRREADTSAEDRLDDDDDVDEDELKSHDEYETREPLVGDLISSDEDDEVEDDDDRLPVRPVRSSVPSWEEAISDIIARNMANRHKSGSGSGNSGGRRGRGRGSRRNGPRDRH